MESSKGADPPEWALEAATPKPLSPELEEMFQEAFPDIRPCEIRPRSREDVREIAWGIAKRYGTRGRYQEESSARIRELTEECVDRAGECG